MKKLLSILGITVISLVMLSGVKLTTPSTETVVEECVQVESWMTIPFTAYEDTIEVEDWMTELFV